MIIMPYGSRLCRGGGNQPPGPQSILLKKEPSPAAKPKIALWHNGVGFSREKPTPL